MSKQRVEVVEITRAMVYSLVLAAVSMSTAPDLARASARLESIEEVRTEEVDEEYFQVEFYDRRGNVLDVKVNPQDGTVVSVEETVL